MPKYLLFIITLVILSSCGDENMNPNEEISTSNDFLIIGLTYGECGGDCSHLYKLENGELFADSEESWWNQQDDPGFHNSVLVNATALAEMEGLAMDFPDYLIQAEEKIFGCPDCGDWGALHVFKEVDGEKRYWTLDNQIESNPEEIQAWSKRIQTLIYELMN